MVDFVFDFKPYKHYIRLDARNNVVDGWSDGANPEKDIDGAVCIREETDYHFWLFDDMDINPSLFTFDAIPLYKWDGEKVLSRTYEEIVADRMNIPKSPPSELEQLRADIDFLAAIGGVEL